ncbi:MAG: flavin reductase [Nitriliruptoraceae bacterium]
MTVPLTLLCVHPHPDDESIACGGVLAASADRGIRTVVVTCTGGEEGENLAGIDLGADDLATHRERELAAALDVLGVDARHQLGYRDSGMAGSDANAHPASFHRADLDEAAARLAGIIRSERPQVVVCDDAAGTYGHPDHVKAHQVVARALELAEDPAASVDGDVWPVPKWYVHALGHGRMAQMHSRLRAAGLASPFGDGDFDEAEVPFGVPDAGITAEVDVHGVLDRKRAAMAAHRSQIAPDSFFLNVPGDAAGDAFGVEQFVRLRPPPNGFETDLFAGVTGVEVTSDTFRAVLGQFATGVTVLTTARDGVPHGMTVNAFASVSLAPPLVLVCVERDSTMSAMITASGLFAVSILGSEHAAISTRFADGDRPSGAAQFAGVPIVTSASGVPRLADALAWLECRLEAIHDGGDHLIVVGAVEALSPGIATEPLLFFRGGYGRFQPS